MDEALKLNMHSNRTTAASIAIVCFVVYLALISLQSILMPLAIAILLYFLIKPLERIIFHKVKRRSLSYGSVVLSAILTIYLISIFLYDNLSEFINEIPEINIALEKKILARSSRMRSLFQESILSFLVCLWFFEQSAQRYFRISQDEQSNQ